MRTNVLRVNNRTEFRQWLTLNGSKESECWIRVKRGKPISPDTFYYLDAVEEALCFGWIDSTYAIVEGVRMQRFTPRRKGSHWTELNKERVRRLEKLGLMTNAGRAVLPPMGPRSFQVDPELAAALKQARAWSRFKAFPPLYQRVRAGRHVLIQTLTYQKPLKLRLQGFFIDQSLTRAKARRRSDPALPPRGRS